MMAQPLEEWPKQEREQRYPWDTWLDGRPWKLTRNEDYESRASTVVQTARTQAKRRGGNVRTRIFEEGEVSEAVVIQFRREA